MLLSFLRQARITAPTCQSSLRSTCSAIMLEVCSFSATVTILSCWLICAMPIRFDSMELCELCRSVKSETHAHTARDSTDSTE